MSSTIPIPPREQLRNRYCSIKQQQVWVSLAQLWPKLEKGGLIQNAQPTASASTHSNVCVCVVTKSSVWSRLCASGSALGPWALAIVVYSSAFFLFSRSLYKRKNKKTKKTTEASPSSVTQIFDVNLITWNIYILKEVITKSSHFPKYSTLVSMKSTENRYQLLQNQSHRPNGFCGNAFSIVL
jgi:hypothetical protein